MAVEYSPFTYTIWRPNTDLSPDNDAILFNFCYYNDSRLDSWCDGISIYVDDEYVGKMTNMAGDGHDNTFIMPERIGINSTKNGKVEAQTLRFSQSGSDYWARVQIRIQHLGRNKSHKIKVQTKWTPNRGTAEWEDVVFYSHSYWQSMPSDGQVSSIGRNRARWTNTSAPSKQDQHVFILKQNQSTDNWIEANDNNSVFSKKVVSANRSETEETFHCDFDVESNYMPTTFYPRYYFNLTSFTEGDRHLFDYCNAFQTVYYYRAKNVKASFDPWKKAVTLTWDTECYQSGASTDGKWMVFRVKDDVAKLAGTTSAFKDRTFTDQSSSLQLDDEYTYEVYFLPNSWGEVSASKCADDLKASVKVKTPFDYNISLTAEGQDRSIRLRWEAPAILANGDYQYTVYRSMGNGSFETLKKIPVSQLAQTLYEYEDTDIPNSSASYHYYVGIKVMGKDFESNQHVASVSGFSRVTEIKASKGGYDNTVKVNWKAELLGSTATYYELSRRVLNSQADWEIIYTTSGTGVSYSYNDQTLTNGVYYEYRVLSYNLNDKNERYGEAEALTNGFCSLTGTISGNITYGNGTAVSDVRVNLELAANGNQSELSQFYSLLSNGANGGIRWKVEKSLAAKKLAGKNWTTQFYLRPSDGCLTPVVFEADGVILSLGDYRSSDSTFALLLNGSAVGDLRLHTDQFTHVTMTYKGSGTFLFYTIDKEGQLNTATASSPAYKGFASEETTLYFAASADGSSATGYVGHIDDVRFFADRALTADEVRKDYDHTLTGQEKGLLAYWPLDEGLTGQRDAYDYSSSNGSPNENHGELMPNSRVDQIVPEESQLSIYAMTDESGNYIIRGIHYQGNGTNYVLRPQKGIHEFSPRTMTRYISATSNVYSSSSFTDESSFPVSGVVYYQGTNYPVEDCFVKIDGAVVSVDGELVKTDKEGRFSIDVPIGNHFVSVERSGHTFTLNGRYPETGKHEFDRAMTGLTFWDNTLVMVTGRVDGGAIEQARPMGFGSSVNNIGVAEIELEADYMMNATQQTVGSALIWEAAAQPRYFDDGNPRVANTIVTGYGSNDAAKRITITTDKLTGEFSAMLPPLNYTVKSVRLLSNPELDFGEYAAHIDASNANAVYTDSLKNESGSYDYFKYAAKFNLAYRSTPQLEVSDPDADEGAMGIKTYKFTHADGTTEDVDIYTVDGQGNVSYAYRYPVFLQLDKYKLNFRGYERYENHDEGAPLTYQDVPLKDVGVNIANQFSVANHFYQKDGSLALVPADGFSLDSLGRGTYVFQVGAPCLLEEENFSRALAISYNIKGNRFSLPEIRGIVFGNIPTGNNFVTAGPDQVLMVLRDPPGSGSSYTWEKGYSCSQTMTYDTTHVASEGVNANFMVGVKLATAVGTPGALTIHSEEHTVDAGKGYTFTETWFNSKGYTTTTTLTESISTSSDPQFDGPDADIFIGRSTNIIIGRARDVRLHRGDDDRPHLGMKEVFTIGNEFGTEFRYTQYYVRHTLIPNLKATRNQLILPKGTVVQNDGTYYKYVSLVDEDDPSFGQNGSYMRIEPKHSISTGDGDSGITDSVMWCNQQVKRWESILADNERAKLMAIDNRSEYLDKNYSFDAGSSITVTDEVANDTTLSSSFQFYFGYEVHAVKNFGNDFTSVDVELSGGYNNIKTSMEEETTTVTQTFSYTLAEEQPYDALTVDVFKAPDNFGHIFVTRGGQTSGNWEPQQVTHYFRPGTEIMSQTQKVSVPKIYIETPIVNNVPVGESAIFKVRFANESETRSTVPVVIGMDNGTNPAGAKVLAGGGTVNKGIEDVLSYGSPVEHTVTITQTDYDVLDYRIGLILFDSWQATPSVYPANSDTAYIEAHFVPASSKVDLATSTPYVNSELEGPASFTLSDYNLNLKNLRTISIRHKGENDQEWVTDQVWNTLTNCETKEDSLQAVTTPTLCYEVDMSHPVRWPEQNYLFQAVTMSDFGGNKEYNYSEVVKVVKDVSAPVVLGTPTPSNGLCTFDKDISVSFNEDIRGELLTADDNISVIGRLNEMELTHQTALHFEGGEGARSEAKLQFKGKDMAVNLWTRWMGGKGCLIGQGTYGNNLGLLVDETGHLVVRVGEQQISSKAALPQNEWLFLSLSVNNPQQTPMVTADYATADETVSLFDHQELPVVINTDGIVSIGQSYHGDIHELTLWDYARPFSVAVSERSKTKNQFTPHLMAYWPMDEGYGSKVTEKVRACNLAMTAGTTWYQASVNYALQVEPQQRLAVNLSNCATESDEDYLMQLWFRVDLAQQALTPIFSLNNDHTRLVVSAADGHLSLYSNGRETLVSAHDFRDAQWHQFSMMVHKSSRANANLYLDGKSAAMLSSDEVADLGGMLVLGGGMKGYVDELRIMHDFYPAETILNNIYQRADSLYASSMGLKMYYPFEKTVTNTYGQPETKPALTDLGASQTGAVMALEGPQPSCTAEVAPSLRPVSEMKNVKFKFFTTERSVFIMLDEDPAAVQGCRLYATVRGIKDYSGNTLDQVTWSFVVDDNTLDVGPNAFSGLIDENTEAKGRVYSVMLFNQGTETKAWTIEGLPEWMEASDRSGVLEPEEIKFIDLTVMESAPVGINEGTIFFIDDNAISRPVNYSITKLVNRQTWAVDAKDYSNTMNIIGQVMVDGVIQENPYSMIAAFDKADRCIGVASPSYYSRYGSYFFLLNIYGNQEDEGLNFRYYDANTGVVYPSFTMTVGQTEVSPWFKPNTVYGTMGMPLLWKADDDIEQHLDIHEGWQWLSLYAAPDASVIDELMTLVTADGTPVVEEVVCNDQFARHDIGQPWYGELNTMQTGVMYKVKGRAEGRLNVVGASAARLRQPLTIHPQWNWLGANVSSLTSLSVALADMNPEEGDVIKNQHKMAIYSQGGWVGTLSAVTPGEGYFYRSEAADDKQFTYPSPSVMRSNRMLAATASDGDRESVFGPYHPEWYEGTMTITAVVDDGNGRMARCELAAYNDEGVLCGNKFSHDEDSRHLIYMVVHGDASRPIHFQVAVSDAEGQTDTQVIYDIAESVTFEDGKSLGSAEQPVVLHLLTTAVDGIQSDRSARHTYKSVEDHRIIIHRGDKRYSTTGVERH